MKKIIFLLTSICLWAYQLPAQQSSHEVADLHAATVNSSLYQEQKEYSDSLFVIVGQFITPVIFEVDKYHIKPTSQLETAIDSIKRSRNNLAFIWIEGSASPEGPVRWNRKLGQYRAEALADYISKNTGLESNLLRVNNLGEDWNSLDLILDSIIEFPNRERLTAILTKEQDCEVRKQKIQELDGGKTWRRLIDELFPPLRNARLAIVSAYPKHAPIAPSLLLPAMTFAPLQAEDMPRPVSNSASAYDMSEGSNWKIAVKTNLLFDAILVANLGVEISPWQHWSLDIPVWYSPYNITSTRNIRLLAVQPEVRWWPKEAMTGHFVGLHTHVAGFNIALNDYARYQDPNHALWGMGVSYGYTMTLGKSNRWGMEFNIGAGFAKYQYDAYRNWNNGPKFKSGSDCYWGITRAGITLSYKWDLSR